MVHVASEMERQGFETPLLIGGATTSRKHTAVKIAPEYGDGTTIHVLDASRAVDVVGRLLNPSLRGELDARNREQQRAAREAFKQQSGAPLVPYETAVKRRFRPGPAPSPVCRPEFLGTRAIASMPLGEIVPYIDWAPLFHAWELKGTFPGILDHPSYGATARELFENAQRLLDRIVEQRLLTANGVYGFFPANADGDDVVVFDDPERSSELLRFHTLRQQRARQGGKPYFALADFVAPIADGRIDYLGGFAVTAGIGIEKIVAEFEKDHDDYNAIMTKALADRLAEAFAELLHERARRDWGYGKTEELTKDDLKRERYRGIRPAPGYPSCPDHTEKRTLWTLLDAEQATGIALTESCAMMPAASVSGLYFSHPEARYFSVGNIGRDQVESYARRKGIPVDEVERWLAPNLDYDPRVAAS
jgi:5-methyltetrahydrofolate--homocysteine methyltransferase